MKKLHNLLLITGLLVLTVSLAQADIWYRDMDNDGWGDDGDFIDSPTQPAGYVPTPGDCDDMNNQVNPGATEYPADGMDSDCDGNELCYLDGDFDGWSVNSTVLSPDIACDGYGEAAWLTNPEDCDDSNDQVNPGMNEIPGDGIDSDCDGGELCWADLDDDGWSSPNLIASMDLDCMDPHEQPAPSTPFDCDDSDYMTNPGAPEVCDDGIDQDCDGSDLTSLIYYYDSDGDGYGNPENYDWFCEDPLPGYITDNTDCDDTNDTVHPGAPELCGDLVDNDCDTQIDEDCTVFEILTVADVGNDQGGQVRLTWRRFADDAPGVGDEITGYDIYRRIDAYKSAANDKAWPPGDWDFIRQVPASGEEEYNSVVPSLCDSTDTGLCWSVYFLRARTASTYVFHDTAPDSGYSIDNLAPEAPSGLAAAYEVSSVSLSWDESEAADFNYFRIYRAEDPAFVPGPGNLVHSTTATAWTDLISDSWSRRYKVSAVDFSGNEGPAASVLYASGVDMPSATGRLTLHANVPNPFNPSTIIRFELPTAQQVRLEIFALNGRKVATLLDMRRDAGLHRVIWDGRGDNGQRVASGSYIYRLDAGGQVLSRRMMMLK